MLRKSLLQKGGVKRNIIITNNPNDSRLKSYNDSLNLYNAYQMQDKLMGDEKGSPGIFDKNYSWTTKELKDRRIVKKGKKAAIDFLNEHEQFSTGFDDFSARKEDKILIDYYKKLGFKDSQIMYHSSPDIVSDVIRPIGNYFDGFAISPVYKKPIQPIVYKKENLLKEKLISQPLVKTTIKDFKIIPNKVKILINKTIPNLPYQVDYFDPFSKKRRSKYFNSDIEGSEFLKDLDPIIGLPEYRNRGDYYTRAFYNKFQYGGENIHKKQRGGDIQSTLGYLDYSPYRFNPYNIINSNNITMNGVSKNLLLIPNKGKVIFAKGNSGNYYFPNASKVIEIPIYQKAGTIYDNPIFDTRLLQRKNYSSDSRIIEDLKVSAEEIKKQKGKEGFVKQKYISQSNPKSKLDILKDLELKRQYVYSHPYSKLNNNGDIEQKYSDRNINGTAIPYSNAAKLDKGLNILSNGIDATSILTGLYGLGKYAIRNSPEVIKNIPNIEKGSRGIDDLGTFTMKGKNKYYNLNEGFVNNKISVSKPNYLRYEKEPLVSKSQFLDSDDKINKYYNDFYSGKIPEDLMFFDYRGSSSPGIKHNNAYLEFNPLEETRKDLAKIAIHKNNLSDSKVPFSNSYTDEFIRNNPKFFINEELKNYKNKPFKTSEFKLRRNKYGGVNSYQKGGEYEASEQEIQNLINKKYKIRYV